VFDKIFCIGLNKTGTKSFARAMRILGYRPLGWQPEAMNLFMSGQIDRLYELVGNYDTFDDWPWPLMARELMTKFPNSGFIITYRASEHIWLDSIKRHAAKSVGGGKFRTYIFGSADPSQDEEAYLQFYRKHYSQVIEFTEELGCRDRVLTVCWELGDGWRELCNFLNKPRPTKQFPHLNSSS
jgi:hypothetical protein